MATDGQVRFIRRSKAAAELAESSGKWLRALLGPRLEIAVKRDPACRKAVEEFIARSIAFCSAMAAFNGSPDGALLIAAAACDYNEAVDAVTTKVHAATAA